VQKTPTAVISVLWTGAAIFSFMQLLSYPHEAVWIPFQTHYFSEKPVALRVEPGTPGFVARNSNYYATEMVLSISILTIIT
jgi:hypothetical protein